MHAPYEYFRKLLAADVNTVLMDDKVGAVAQGVGGEVRWRSGRGLDQGQSQLVT